LTNVPKNRTPFSYNKTLFLEGPGKGYENTLLHASPGIKQKREQEDVIVVKFIK